MNGDYTSYEERQAWEDSRSLVDSFKYDPIGEEAFIISTIRHFIGDDRPELLSDSLGNYYVCAGLRAPTDLFVVNWYLNGVASEELEAALVPGPDNLTCAPVQAPEDGSSWTTVGVRLNPSSPDLLPELKVEDRFEEFYDVYEGAFGSGIGLADCPLYEWHADILEERICWIQAYAYVPPGQFEFAPDLRSRDQYIERFGEMILLVEESALGHQIQINWDLL